jgi:hypothetical protein
MRYQAIDGPKEHPGSARVPSSLPDAVDGRISSGATVSRFEPQLGGSGGESERPEGGDARDRDESEAGAVSLSDALRLANRLTATLRELEERERSAYRLDQETMARIRRLEESARSIAALSQALEERVELTVEDDELASLESLLNAWVDRPNDLLVMVKLAERSTVLARLVAAFRDIRRLLASAGPAAESGE